MKEVIFAAVLLMLGAIALADTPAWDPDEIEVTAAQKVGGEYTADCVIPDKGVSTGIWRLAWTHAEGEYTPSRSRHKLTQLHDGEFVAADIPNMGKYGVAHTEDMREWLWNGGNGLSGERPTILIQIQGLDQYGAGYDDKAGEKMLAKLDEALRTIPALVLYSLPPELRIILWFGGDDVEYAALAIDNRSSRWPYSDNHYAVVIDQGFAHNRNVAATVVHEFGHLIDFRWDVTGGHHQVPGDATWTVRENARRRGEYREFWADQHAKRNGDLSRFVSGHAGLNVREHFAETLTAYMAYRANSGFKRWSFTSSYPDSCRFTQLLEQTASEEMLWWSERVDEAGSGFSGRLLGDDGPIACPGILCG